MKFLRSLKLMVIPSVLMSCSVESPELIPCMCDGSDQTLGILDCMCEPGKKKPVRKVSYIQNKADDQINPSGDQLNAYAYLHQSRGKYAPVQLEYVDFRIPKGKKFDEFDTKLGNYRFRIFGCRRFDKEVFLNQGRAMQKDMKFFDIFYETMNDYYPVVVDKSNSYYAYSDKAQPEYILTAEINDYFMNVCDEFDWENVKKQNLRNGTSEMTVTWRLMDLTKSKVYCKGTTTGYGEMKNGEFKGETLLVERAFADALSKLPEVGCYNTELAKRVPTEVLQEQIAQIQEREKQKTTFKNQFEPELEGIALLQSCGAGEISTTGGAEGTGSITPLITEEKITVNIAENGGSLGKNNEVSGYVDEKGNVVIIEEKTVTQKIEQPVRGQIDENGNFVIINSAVEEHGGSNASGKTISGYIDEKSNFVATHTATEVSENIISKGQIPVGYVDEKGKFVSISTSVEQSGNAEGTGNKVVGYIDENGKFVVTGMRIDENGGADGKGTIIAGYIDEKGKFVSTGMRIDENGGADGKGAVIAGYIDERGKFISTGLRIDENGGIGGDGKAVAGYVDENGNFIVTGIKIDDRGGADGKGTIVAGYVDENGNFVVQSVSVEENGGTEGSGKKLAASIDESGNITASGLRIDENGGVDGSGRTIASLVDEKGNVIISNIRVDRNGSKKPEIFATSGGAYDVSEFQMVEIGRKTAAPTQCNIVGVISSEGKFVSNFTVEERGGSYFYYVQTEERSGGMSKFSDGSSKGLKALALRDNCKEVTIGEDGCTTIQVTKNKITHTDDYWIDIPAETSGGAVTIKSHAAAEKKYSDSKNSFCIQSVKPYDTSVPENMYKLRTSVVSVENPSGRKGAGLIISDDLILTSADLLDKNQNRFDIKAINGMTYKGSAFRVNPNKNVALILLDEKTKFAPLPLRLDLPAVGKDLYMTLGLLDLEEGENYLDNEGQVIGYRYSEDKGAEIIVNTYVQTQTLGSTLIDKNGNITGLSHSGIRAEEGGDLFIPIETALKSLGMDICGVKFTSKRPAAVKAIEKPVSTAIDNYSGSKAPKVMDSKERK